ncbi:MAG TPA: sulfite oxidase [Gaiellaceae bacterium]|nr:sulfite oxidase [Gaiellaceae bacterium]
MDRRELLAAAGIGGLVAGGAAGFGIAQLVDDEEEQPGANGAPAEATGLPSGKNEDNFVVHGESPYTIETRREALGTAPLTASELVFIRQNLELPDPSILDDRDGWTFRVEGVANEQELTVRDLKRLGIASEASVLQCSGNGRGFFEHDPSGSQWEVGACANVIWTGVPVSVVAEELGGVADGMQFLTARGGDPLPEDVDELEAVVERSVPIEKGLEDCLLAWEMNGEPTPLAHGGPLRLIVPGYYGINNVKFVERLAFTEEESPADIQQTGYRVRPIGVDGAPDQPTMWRMGVKSFVTTPSGEESVPPGPVRVFAVAFSGERSIDRLEVSTDGGESWEEAEPYGPDLGPSAWRRYSYAFDAEDGEYVIATRATDDEGDTQPELRMENHRGYGHNGWRDHAVTLEVA